jgi:hypothetical protein
MGLLYLYLFVFTDTFLTSQKTLRVPNKDLRFNAANPVPVWAAGLVDYIITLNNPTESGKRCLQIEKEPYIIMLIIKLKFFLYLSFLILSLSSLQDFFTAQLLFAGQPIEAETHDDVTMLFSDIVGFTSICSTATPMMVINMLQDLYNQFDAFCGQLDVYKVRLAL